MHLVDNQFAGGSSAGTVTPIINGGRISSAAARYAKTNSSTHPYALVIGILLPALVVMGYDPHNIHMGFKIDTNHAGAHGKGGCMPHFMRDPGTWRDWWQRIIYEVTQAVQCAPLVSAMMALSSQVNTWLMTSDTSDSESWLVAAHRLLSRYDRFCVSGILDDLSKPAGEEKELATMRVRSLQPPKPATQWGAGYRRQPGGGVNEGPHKKARKATTHNSWCEHHKRCSRTTEQCGVLHPKSGQPKAPAGPSNGK
jgi:hypothetical protein